MSTLLTLRASLLSVLPPFLGTAKPSLPCWWREQQSTSILKLLIKAKGDVNQCEKEWGYSPLMTASQQGSVEAVELLLSNGANVHLKDTSGRTALDWAIGNEHTAVAAAIRKHIAHLEAAAAAGAGAGAGEGGK